MSDSSNSGDSDEEPVEGFDQTNGLAGNLVGDTDETEDAGTDDDALTDAGSIYTGNVTAGVGHDDPEAEVGSDGEEPI